MPNNIYQNSIRPVTPQVLNGERITVYVPEATNDTKGIANYTDDFIVLQGTVKLNTTKYNDPFNKLSFVKLNNDDFEKDNNDFIQIKWPFAYDKSGSSRANGFGLMKIRDNSLDYLKYDKDGNLALDYDKLAEQFGPNVNIEAHNNDPAAHPYILNLLDDKVDKVGQNTVIINENGVIELKYDARTGTGSSDVNYILVSSNQNKFYASAGPAGPNSYSTSIEQGAGLITLKAVGVQDFEHPVKPTQVLKITPEQITINDDIIATQPYVQDEISKISSVQIRNTAANPIITATQATVQTVATQYIVNNYSRQPIKWDGLIITVTDLQNDKILFIYSDASDLWINAGINNVDLSNYVAKDDITDINLTYGQETLIYDTTDGMTINAQGQIKFKDNTLHSFDSEFNVPLVPADDSITIDVDEANQKFRIKANSKIDVDNQTITKNSANEIQTIGVKYNDNLITAEMIYNATHYIRYKEAGLYVDGVLTKTWEQLIADGDVTITSGVLRVVNKDLAGDLVCDNVDGLTSLNSAFWNCTHLTSLDLSNFNTSNVISMSGMFSSCKALTSLDLSNFNTSNVTSMSGMFGICPKLTNLNLSSFDTSKVKSMIQMFNGCRALTNLDLSNFNTSNVSNMQEMFNYCAYLASLDLSSFDTNKVTSMNGMFRSCSSLTSLDLNNFNTSNVTNMSFMFENCSKLTSLDISNFTFDKVTYYSNMFYNVPADCEILVKSQTEKNWITSKFTNLTNVKIKGAV